MGSGAVFSVCFGKKDKQQMKKSMIASFLFIVLVTLIINIIVFVRIDSILHLLSVPMEIYERKRQEIHV